tara:strand:+ start:1381 stop:1758 length:378 start_codon:yes stop_codon:yes gene_type:complete
MASSILQFALVITYLGTKEVSKTIVLDLESANKTYKELVSKYGQDFNHIIEEVSVPNDEDIEKLKNYFRKEAEGIKSIIQELETGSQDFINGCKSKGIITDTAYWNEQLHNIECKELKLSENNFK